MVTLSEIEVNSKRRGYDNLKQFEVTIFVRNMLSTRWTAQHDAAGDRGSKQQVCRTPRIHIESWRTNVQLTSLFQAHSQNPVLEDHDQNLHGRQDYHRTVLQKSEEVDRLHAAREYHHFEYLCKLTRS